ncbi:F-actin-monooxygenase mical2b isoform 1-T3 [Odontesthes bonariensis]|uniref:F-actin-monooxygenase mical2b isoform X1 n=1 Tax=Odontesthes bonariensis TaxID=219752 RepID=UPI003F58BAD2
MGETEDERTAQASQLFENFFQASTCKGTLQAFSILCRQLELDPLDYSDFYNSLKAAVSSWKVKALWTKLDKRVEQKVYKQNKICQGTRCLIIGGGPCGLRTAIELALLGCKVVVIEKRDTFSRNNVLHLWPYTIHDLRGLGAKKFYGKFCAGAIDHISIRQLQLMLLKVSLILGVEIHVNVEFSKLLEPPEEQTDDSPGWRAEIRPSGHPVSDFDFDVVIGADGRRSTLDGFSRKEFRGKLAIAITANFVNRNTTAEAKVEEISGVAFIFNQKFFLELKEDTGIDLENIVYYKDNTHYFVMTAKKQSLLDKGVIINDYMETERLLSADNVNQEALLSYAREAADFGTNYELPSLDYAINHYGQPDVAMFDFTSMYASENAALIREKHGRQLLVALVGDSLLEPFWPMGTGCARGFLAAFDTAWMVRSWSQGKSPLEILAERESLYRLLPQTTTENISKNFQQYSIDPSTRYPNLNSSCVRPHQVRHLFIDGQQDLGQVGKGGPKRRSVNLSRRESEVRPGRLLTWCQKQTQGYRGVEVTNLASSWRNGLALCALVHRQRPELIDFDSLNEEDVAANNQLAFDVAEREFGIQPVTTGKEMAAEAEPDKLLMVLYLSKFYEAFRNSPRNNNVSKEADENAEEYPSKTNHKLQNPPQPRKRTPRDDKKLEDDSVNKRRRKGSSYLSELSCHSAPPAGEDGELRANKVRSMATQLLAKFEENSSTVKIRTKSGDPSSPSFSPPVSPSATPPPLSDEEDEEERENPRFAKPKDTRSLPRLPPPRPKWQPSVYLQLLENPSAFAQKTSFPCRSPSPSCSKSPLSSPRSLSPSVAERYHPECTSPDQSSERSEESVQQSKNQRLSSREFAKKSIQERAVHLSSMFHGSNKPSAALSVSQVDFSTSSSPPPPAPPLSLSKSSYPVVHPVSDPAVQSGFSSAPPHSPGDENKPKIRSSTPLSYADSEKKKTEQFSSSSCETSPILVHESLKIPTNCDLERINESSWRNVENEKERVHKSARGAFDDREFIKNGHNQSPESRDSESPRRTAPKSVVRSESCPTGAPSYSKERTVGKVSSAIDAKAQMLAILYETDHRPKAAPCVARRELPAGLGGSDICHFCTKRVYVMERLSAEGYFFHRECFRCDVCNCTLRLGGHTFDSQEAKFYCKMHYAQRQNGSHLGRFRRRLDDQSRVRTSALDVGICATTGSIQMQSPDGASGLQAEQRDKGQNRDLEDTEMAVDALNASCLVRPTKEDDAVTQGQSQPSTKDQCNTKNKNRWKRKIRATFPLIIIKHFQRRLPLDEEGVETVPEADFEEIASAGKHSDSKGSSKTSADTQNPSVGSEKLLNLEVQTEADKPQMHSSQNGTASQSQTSAFQVIANAFRRTFNGSSHSSSSKTAVIMRPKHDGCRKQRPMSEGAFSFSSLFKPVAPKSTVEERRASMWDPQWASIEADPWGEGRDLPSLLQQVSLKSQRDSEGGFSDGIASRSRKRVDLFSSLKLRKRQLSDSEGKDHEDQKEIRTILSNLRNKASSQQNLEATSSSADESETLTSNHQQYSGRLKKKQEKMVPQQNKREQLKRLHRAQVIQRQLEEVGEKQRDIEERGVAIEKIIRGETDSPQLEDSDEAQLYQSWFKLVLEKNRLARYESELMIFAQELELEDTQSRLQQDLRHRMAVEDTNKSATELQEEQGILEEIMKTVEKRDMLVYILEEQRLKERAEDKDLESLVLSKGYEFHWAQENDRWGGEEAEVRAGC